MKAHSLKDKGLSLGGSLQSQNIRRRTSVRLRLVVVLVVTFVAVVVAAPVVVYVFPKMSLALILTLMREMGNASIKNGIIVRTTHYL